ncbi:MAG: S8 family serine peptidase, partial [Clostridia bacterium]|nr:S8 family serine peptidase [Clostridia bacterium]
MIGDDPSDSNGHGTAMAGYIHSVNPDAKILSIKALGADGTGDASAVYAAIEYAISRKASIINLSITAARKLENAAVITAIEEAQANGIQVVGAAGNKAKKADYYVPGCVTGAYIIGACDEHGQKIPSSNYGDTVDFNVVAESTSEAAAKFSGYLSMGKNEANEILVFPTSYEYKEPEPEKPEDPEPGEEETEETVTLKLQIRHGGHAFITYDDKKTELWKDQDGTMNHEGELSFDSDESDLFFTGTFPKNAQISLDVAPNSDYEMTLYRINDQPASGSHQDLVLSSDTEVNIGFSP